MDITVPFMQQSAFTPTFEICVKPTTGSLGLSWEQCERSSRAITQTKCSWMKEAFKNDHSPQTECDPPLSVLLSPTLLPLLSLIPELPLFILPAAPLPVPVRPCACQRHLACASTWSDKYSLPSRHQRAACVSLFSQSFWGADWQRSHKERRRSGPILEKREKKWGGTEIWGGERVIKIHPTVRTKGGMKKGENAGEGECRGGGKIWGEKKIVSLSRSLNSPPPLPLNDGLWVTGQSSSETPGNKGGRGGRVERSRRWIHEEQEGKKGREHQLFGMLSLPRFAVAGWTEGQQLTQLQDKLSEGTTPALTADPAACWFSFSPPLFFAGKCLPLFRCPWQTQELQPSERL